MWFKFLRFSFRVYYRKFSKIFSVEIFLRVPFCAKEKMRAELAKKISAFLKSLTNKTEFEMHEKVVGRHLQMGNWKGMQNLKVGFRTFFKGTENCMQSEMLDSISVWIWFYHLNSMNKKKMMYQKFRENVSL